MPLLFEPLRLVLARQLNGLTQSALATRLGVSQAWISMLEGTTGQPTEEQLKQIAAQLQCTSLMRLRG